MKEIKAYIRLEKVEEVNNALEAAGVLGFTVIEVKALGKASVPETEQYSIEFSEKFSTIAKLEVVCNDEDIDRLVDVIKENAHTGHSGDGMIFVSDISCAVKIRTGERGEGALRSG
ncbi:MAG: P-II family nitrogen regulator [Thermodesulfobacteriota bacterium]